MLDSMIVIFVGKRVGAFSVLSLEFTDFPVRDIDGQVSHLWQNFVEN